MNIVFQRSRSRDLLSAMIVIFFSFFTWSKNAIFERIESNNSNRERERERRFRVVDQGVMEGEKYVVGSRRMWRADEHVGLDAIGQMRYCRRNRTCSRPDLDISCVSHPLPPFLSPSLSLLSMSILLSTFSPNSPKRKESLLKLSPLFAFERIPFPRCVERTI